jgi:hypothetical protein
LLVVANDDVDRPQCVFRVILDLSGTAIRRSVEGERHQSLVFHKSAHCVLIQLFDPESAEENRQYTNLILGPQFCTEWTAIGERSVAPSYIDRAAIVFAKPDRSL